VLHVSDKFGLFFFITGTEGARSIEKEITRIALSAATQANYRGTPTGHVLLCWNAREFIRRPPHPQVATLHLLSMWICHKQTRQTDSQDSGLCQRKRHSHTRTQSTGGIPQGRGHPSQSIVLYLAKLALGRVIFHSQNERAICGCRGARKEQGEISCQLVPLNAHARRMQRAPCDDQAIRGEAAYQETLPQWIHNPNWQIQRGRRKCDQGRPR